MTTTNCTGGAGTFTALLIAGLVVAGCNGESQTGSEPAGAAVAESAAEATHSPVAAAEFPRRPFWGDLHLHSRYSFDSYSFGNKALSPDDAYRFAKGETLNAHNGDTAMLRRPLDFLMVSDHAEYLGVLPAIEEGNELIASTPLGERWGKWLANDDVPAVLDEYIGVVNRTRPLDSYVPKTFLASVWREIAASADRHNDPGTFTALIGFEWTSMVDGDNLHRNVVFRGNADDTSGIVPFSALDSPDPEALWDWFESIEAETGGVLAIPHNGNLSDGSMFAETTLGGAPIDRGYAERRSRWEPVAEVTQVKGDGEAHPMLSPADEFADFENWDQYDINFNPKPDDRKRDMYQHEYARGALNVGMKLDASLGVNPYKFGMIGSTDSHTAMSTADDDNFFGKFPDSEPGPERLSNTMGGVLWANRFLTSSGYAAVWATENTRGAIFDALKRREVYATTGPRIVVRFFGGWQFDAEALSAGDVAKHGYERGVPMGGDLAVAPEGSAPAFIVTAAMDPDGAHLDRVQIVKGWLTADGEMAETVYDVAWSGDRTPDSETGRLAPVGSTVDVETATYSNTIGSSDLAAVWRDPDFDPALRAFYYARVLEIPTPRWTTYDAVRFGEPLPEDVPSAVQQRAYTSPIWYTPTAADPAG